MDPEFENMSTDVGERRGVNTSQLQVLLDHPPAGRLLATEQSRIEQVPFCVGKNSHLLQNHCLKLSVPAVIIPSTPVTSRHLSTSLRNCMLPFANTGMLTLRLYNEFIFLLVGLPPPLLEKPEPRFLFPNILLDSSDVLPAGKTSICSFLVPSTSMYSQQLEKVT